MGPDHPAYVAFTSGSTGRPKAILGPHAPLPHFLAWHCGSFGLGEADRFSLLSGLAHDPLLRDLFTPLWSGGTLCIPTGSDFDLITRSLAAAGVRFDTRKDVIRLSFHVCNTPDDAIAIAKAWGGG